MRPQENLPASPSTVDPRRRTLLAGALGLAGGASLLSLAACGGGTSDSAASVRFTNATVDYASVDFYLANTKAVSALANAGATSGWIEEDAGALQVNLTSAGSTTSRLAETHSFAEATATTVLAYGQLSQSLKLRYFEESNGAADSGSVKLRVFQAAPALDALDLYVSNADTLSGLSPTLSVSAYEALSSFVALAADAYRLRITVGGNPANILFDSSGKVTLASKAAITLLVVPRASGSLPNVTLLPEQAAAAVVVNALV